MAIETPTQEFDTETKPPQDETTVSVPDTTSSPPTGVSPAEFKELREEVSSQLAELQGLKTDAALVRKLRDVLGGPEGERRGPENERDKYVRKEILRLLPELEDYERIKQLFPVALQTMEAIVEERNTERASVAQEHMRTLMGDLGLDPKDDDTVSYLEETLTKEIGKNPELLKRWTRGDVKGAVNKAFEKVQSKLFAPVRAKVKKGAVTPILETPRATPRGGAIPSPANAVENKPKVNLADASRDGVHKVHDGAWDYLQELLNREG